MALVLGAVIGLRLRPQHLLADLLREGLALHLGEQRVERLGRDHLAEREGDAERLEIVLQRDQLLARRRLVDAVHAHRPLRLERLRGGDVGGDHIVLDQPVGVQALAGDDGGDRAGRVELDAAFGQVEVERRAGIARLGQCPPRAPQRLQRRQMLARAGIDRGLRFLIGDVGRAADDGAGEAVAADRALGGDDEMAGQHRAVLALDEAAGVGRQHLGQHRHDAVGEVDAVAAFARRAVERRPFADVVGHVGDGDDRVPPAILTGSRPHRVVVVAGVGGVDGQDRQVAQVLALAQRLVRRLLRLLGRRLAEAVRQALGVDRDQREAARRERVAEHLDHPRGLVRRPPRRLGEHEVADLRFAAIRHEEVDPRLLVDRARAGSRPHRGAGCRGRTPRSWPASSSGSRCGRARSPRSAPARGRPARARRAWSPRRCGRAAAGCERSQLSGTANTPSATSTTRSTVTFGRPPPLWTVRFAPASSCPASAMSRSRRLQRDLVLRVEAERLGDLALADRGRRGGDEGEDLLGGRQAGRRGRGAAGHAPVVGAGAGRRKGGGERPRR